MNRRIAFIIAFLVVALMGAAFLACAVLVGPALGDVLAGIFRPAQRRTGAELHHLVARRRGQPQHALGHARLAVVVELLAAGEDAHGGYVELRGIAAASCELRPQRRQSFLAKRDT